MIFCEGDDQGRHECLIGHPMDGGEAEPSHAAKRMAYQQYLLTAQAIFDAELLKIEREASE